MIEKTAAKAAIITLRDQENCQIVNDVELEQEYHSPLIRGFSHEAIVYYLTNLRTIDPWAAFQKNHYPYRPIQMSKVCPPDTIADKTFLNWLKGEGMEDTIVVELDRMAGYWTAINLFLEKSSDPQADQLLDFMTDNFDLFRRSWRASQDMTRHRQANTALLNQASSGGAPVCLVDANGELIECNDLFRDLIKSDGIRLSGNGQKLSFARSVSLHGLDRWEQHDLLRHNVDSPSILILASSVDPDPLFADRREKLWVLTCSHSAANKTSPTTIPTNNIHLLTAQERKMYMSIVEGNSIAKAGETIGLKRSRAFEVWVSAKEKLEISSSHKLR